MKLINCVGGVLIASHNFVSSKIINYSQVHSHLPFIDILSCKCRIGFKSFYIIIVYMPPSTSVSGYELFFDLLEEHKFVNYNNVLHVGHLKTTKFYSRDPNDTKLNAVYGFLNIFGYKQFNDIFHSKNNLLDLVKSNKLCEVETDLCL